MRDLPTGIRLRFRPLTVGDGYTVARWRNSASARRSFFSGAVVTPDSHAAFVALRPADDLLWIVELTAALPTAREGTPIGMLSLQVNRHDRTGEYGRAFLDEAYRGHGYWMETECLLLDFGIQTLGLDLVWLEIFADNTEMCAIHHKFGWLEGAIRPHGSGRDILRMEYPAAQWRERRAAAWDQVRQKIHGKAAPVLVACG